MRNWYWFEWVCGSVCALVVLAVAVSVWQAVAHRNDPTFELVVNQWQCGKESTAATLQPMIVGKVTILMPMNHTQCDEWVRKP